jgi:hypothetical protein
MVTSRKNSCLSSCHAQPQVAFPAQGMACEAQDCHPRGPVHDTNEGLGLPPLPPPIVLQPKGVSLEPYLEVIMAP